MKKNTLTNNLENMKTKLITFCVTITIFLNACSDYEEFISDQPDIMTRAIVDKNHPSISNPDLINNWENLTRVYLNTKEPTSWTGYRDNAARRCPLSTSKYCCKLWKPIYELVWMELITQ